MLSIFVKIIAISRSHKMNILDQAEDHCDHINSTAEKWKSLLGVEVRFTGYLLACDQIN